ncbi:hypothetical protein LCGC14_0171210 [marine sediment metagenome]|jgi:hypothetical protein|uniref:Uncharacterized protein n=1 Tax=marine sediment metagenome TaxID=412755 RepID=A0A0F9XAV6_9ZZZZ
MFKKINAIALMIATISLSGCFEPDTNLSGLSEDTYQASGANPLPMSFPAGESSIAKPRDEFNKPTPPTRFIPPSTWVVYMASPGWTSGGLKITRRLSSDAAAAAQVKTFLRANLLTNQVKLVWLQYDPNPAQEMMGDKPVSKGNLIPHYIQPFGPDVDFFVHSPAERFAGNGDSLSFDQWVKPYLPFAKPAGDDFVTNDNFHLSQGFSDVNSDYWDDWSRIWFIVNPEGVVVDAYFSNLGTGKTYGSIRPINSLMHHLGLDSEKLIIPQLVEHSYISKYTPPYWDQLVENTLDLFLNPGDN